MKWTHERWVHVRENMSIFNNLAINATIILVVSALFIRKMTWLLTEIKNIIDHIWWLPSWPEIYITVIKHIILIICSWFIYLQLRLQIHVLDSIMSQIIICKINYVYPILLHFVMPIFVQCEKNIVTHIRKWCKHFSITCILKNLWIDRS